VEPYRNLSTFYDRNWTKVATRYVDIVTETLRELEQERARILDLACGTGIMAVSLARAGRRVMGVDRSPEMIRVAKSNAGNLRGVDFRIQDIASLRLRGKFDIVTCSFNSMNYLTCEDELMSMYESVAGVLKYGGLFLFDSNTELMYLNRHEGTNIHVFDGEVVHQEMKYDKAAKEARTVFCFPDGSFELHRQRPYDLRDLEPLLKCSGLTILEEHGGLAGEPYDSESERLFCVANRARR
jgi:SAM-dependent methyltransferase